MTQPHYCILRAKKLKSFGSIAGSAKHTFREIPTPNADPDRTRLNKTIGAQDSAAVCAAIEARLPAKRRNDAVLCIEYLITASPEWFKTAPTEQQNGYFKEAVAWLRQRHGAENVVCLNMQHDEKSPHLVAYVVPLTKDGRLSAKDFLGGRQKLTAMQTEFAKVVGAPAGLQRGVEGSKAVHTTAKQYAAAMQENPALAPPAPLPAPSIADRLSGRWAEKQAQHHQEQVEHAALVEKARNEARVGRQNRQRQAAALERMRAEIEEAKRHAAEATQLRGEKARLERELREQRTYFQRQIDTVKAALAKALDQVEGLLRRNRLLEARVASAEAEADELRAILAPDESRPDLVPSGAQCI
jgi:hypothetical protein